MLKDPYAKKNFFYTSPPVCISANNTINSNENEILFFLAKSRMIRNALPI
jgi:hypothetical protein